MTLQLIFTETADIRIESAIQSDIDQEAALMEAMTMSDEGLVYLVHFSSRLHHAGHYLGWCSNRLTDRLAEHRAGRGARLLQVVNDLGITYEVVRVWPGSRSVERQLKDRHEGPRLCPLCQSTARKGTAHGN